MRTSNIIIVALVATLVCPLVVNTASGQLPLEPSKQKGQNVIAAYEGWYRNSDGTFSLLVGYFNRNHQETIDIPIGADNRRMVLYQKLGMYDRALNLYLDLRSSPSAIGVSENARILANLGGDVREHRDNRVARTEDLTRSSPTNPRSIRTYRHFEERRRNLSVEQAHLSAVLLDLRQVPIGALGR